MKANHLPDTYLLERIAKDNEKAFCSLFERYKDRFYAAALKMTHSPDTAEEIVQEVFVSLWQRRDKLPEIANPKSYLFTIVYNTIARHFKKLASEKIMKKDLEGRMTQAENYTEQNIFEKESRQRLQNIVDSLPSKQQLIYKLSKEDGLSRNAIAERLDISPNTVKIIY